MKKEFYPILMGASPQTPGVYRIGELRISRRHWVVELFIRSLITRRSGRSPALPYPPNEYVTLLKNQGLVNNYLKKQLFIDIFKLIAGKNFYKMKQTASSTLN